MLLTWYLKDTMFLALTETNFFSEIMTLSY